MSSRSSLSQLFTWRSAICDSGLPPTLRHVALTLSLHMNERGGSCFPTHDQLKDETGLGRSTVIRALGELEERGWLTRMSGGGRKRGGNGRATEYTATVPERDGTDEDTVPLRDEYRPAAGQYRPGAGHQDDIQDVSKDVKTLAAPPRVRVDGQDLPVNALARACGVDMRNRAKASELTKALKDIRQYAWDDMPPETRAGLDELGDPAAFDRHLAVVIGDRGRAYQQHPKLRGAMLTPSALAKWWHDLDPRRTANGHGSRFESIDELG